MKYCLIEDLNTDFELPNNYVYVALTQQAVYQLDKRIISYITIEDFYTSGEIRGDTDKYLYDQLKWFEDLDIIIKEMYPVARKKNIKLASIYYYWLKYMVDNIILTSKIIKIFIDSVRPDKIMFINTNYNKDIISHILHFRNVESTYSRIIEPLCKKNGIPFERLIINISKKNDNGNKSIKSIVRNSFPTSFRFIKRMREVFKGIIYIILLHSFTGSKKYKALLLTKSQNIYEICKELKKSVFDYHIFDEIDNMKYGLLSLNKSNHLHLYPNKNNENNGQNITNQINRDKIYKWVNEKCNLDVSDILKSRVDYFLDTICAQILSMVSVFEKYYEKNNIDYVFTDKIYSLEEHAAIVAAGLSIKTKSVYVCHGSDLIEAKYRFFAIYRFFDYCISPSKVEADHENTVRKIFQKKTPLVFHSDYFSKLYKPKKNIYRKIKSSKKKQIILYVPIMCSPWPQRPVELTQSFPMEYVKWHKSLLVYFATRLDCIIIWKGLFIPNQKFDMVQNIIEDLNYKNIYYHSNKLDYWLNRVDKVICDTPSTAFFQSIFSGLPTMSLYRPNDQKLQKNVLSVFGNSLCPYTSVDEGLKHVVNFLNDSASRYLVELPKSHVSISDVLLEEKS